jgi:hypothetical protein
MMRIGQVRVRMNGTRGHRIDDRWCLLRLSCKLCIILIYSPKHNSRSVLISNPKTTNNEIEAKAQWRKKPNPEIPRKKP